MESCVTEGGKNTECSAATLPTTIQCEEENSNVYPRTIRFMLPLGATLNMDGSDQYRAYLRGSIKWHHPQPWKGSCGLVDSLASCRNVISPPWGLFVCLFVCFFLFATFLFVIQKFEKEDCDFAIVVNTKCDVTKKIDILNLTFCFLLSMLWPSYIKRHLNGYFYRPEIIKTPYLKQSWRKTCQTLMSTDQVEASWPLLHQSFSWYRYHLVT